VVTTIIRRIQTGLSLLYLASAALLLMAIMTPSAHATDDYLSLPIDGWRLVTDNVMGGVSAGKTYRDERQGKVCIALQGDVSTDNNGGFIQIAMDMEQPMADKVAKYDGIRMQVAGNSETYNIHLRTRDLWFPWQAYRATFQSSGQWQQIDLPFDAFEPYKTSSKLDINRLKRIGIVAIGRDFAADVCVADIGFYRADK
jgi:hypothetical protein